jgi:hypothetical protein
MATVTTGKMSMSGPENLAFSAGSRLQFSNGVALSAMTAPLLVTNAVTTLSAINQVGIDIVGDLSIGQFPSIKSANLGGNGFAAFSLGNYQPHVSAYLSNNTAVGNGCVGGGWR